MQHIVDRHALGLSDCIGRRFAEVLAGLPPDLAEEGALLRFLGPEVYVGLRAGKKVQAVPGAGGGDVEEAAGLDVLGFLVELADILICRVFAGAGGVDGGEEERTPARGARCPLVRGPTSSRGSSRRSPS